MDYGFLCRYLTALRALLRERSNTNSESSLQRLGKSTKMNINAESNENLTIRSEPYFSLLYFFSKTVCLHYVLGR